MWPSGVARATYSLAIEPLAPARLSTITVCPSSGPSFCAMVRAIASLPPPAAVGTTMVMVLAGKATAAGAAVAAMLAAIRGAISCFTGSSFSEEASSRVRRREKT